MKMQQNHTRPAHCFYPTIPMNLVTHPSYIDKGGQGLNLLPLVDLIGQQLTNTAAAVAAYAMHGR